jgi:hypothetical protein
MECHNNSFLPDITYPVPSFLLWNLYYLPFYSPVYPLDVLPGCLVEVESLWLLVALDCQCIFRQALLYLESNDAVESAELVVGDYSEVDWKLVDTIFVELESDFWRW